MGIHKLLCRLKSRRSVPIGGLVTILCDSDSAAQVVKHRSWTSGILIFDLMKELVCITGCHFRLVWIPAKTGARTFQDQVDLLLRSPGEQWEEVPTQVPLCLGEALAVLEKPSLGDRAGMLLPDIKKIPAGWNRGDLIAFWSGCPHGEWIDVKAWNPKLILEARDRKIIPTAAWAAGLGTREMMAARYADAAVTCDAPPMESDLEEELSAHGQPEGDSSESGSDDDN